MLRALVWKEWRQQRSIVAAGVGLGVLLPVVAFAAALSTAERVYNLDFAEMVPFLIAALIWPLFAAIAGATAHADEKEGGSLGFLLSRPVTRTRVWGAKVATALGALFLVIVATFTIGQLVNLLMLADLPQFPFSSDPVSSSFLTPAATQAVVILFSLVAFAGALLFANLVRQPLVAVGGGVLVAGLVVASGIWVEKMLSSNPRLSTGSEDFHVAFLSVAFVALCAAACYVFTVGAGATGADLVRPFAVATCGVLLTLGLGAMAVGATTTRIDIPTASLHVEGPIPGQNAVLVLLRGTPFQGAEYWRVGPDGNRRLTDRQASSASVTADGAWIVYRTRLGPLGSRGTACRTRAVRSDGSGDRPLLPMCGVQFLSSDGRWLVASPSVRATRVMVAPVDGSAEPRWVSFARTDAAGSRLVDWALGDTRLLLRSPRGLYLLDPDGGGVTEVLRDDDAVTITIRTGNDTHVVVQRRYTDTDAEGRRRSSYRQSLVDLRGGEAVPLLDECAYRAQVALSGEGDTLFYAECPNPADGRSHLRMLELAPGLAVRTGSGVGGAPWSDDARADGEGVLLASFDGEINYMQPSPTGERVLLQTQWRPSSGRRVYRTVVVDRAGNLVEPPGLRRGAAGGTWYFRAWIDDRSMVLWRPNCLGCPWADRVIALDVVTGETTSLTGGERPASPRGDDGPAAPAGRNAP